MGIVHVIMVAFQPLATPEEIRGACDRLLALKEKCVHPETNKQYIKSFIGGRDSSPEGFQRGITHVFVAEFETEDDRKYYIEKDPAHMELVQSLGGLAAQLQVVDFTPGAF